MQSSRRVRLNPQQTMVQKDKQKMLSYKYGISGMDFCECVGVGLYVCACVSVCVCLSVCVGVCEIRYFPL